MGINVLLVDDSATTRAVIRKTLSLAGVRMATLHEAAKIGLKSVPWPKQYYSGKSQYETNLARAAATAAPAR